MKKPKADLLQGTLELLVLRLLRSGQLNGWDIMQRIQLVSGEVLSVTPGSLYPALHRLEERGLISAVWGHRKTTGGRSSTASPPRGENNLKLNAKLGNASQAPSRRSYGTLERRLQ